MGSGNVSDPLSCFPSIQPLETGFLHFFFCLLFQSSNLRPRLLLAGVAALEEPHLFWGANGLLEETLLIQKCLKWVVLPYIALFYDLGKRSLVKPHIEWKSSQCRIRNGPMPKGEQKSKENTGFRAMYILLKFHIYEISCESSTWNFKNSSNIRFILLQETRTEGAL